MPDTDSTPAPRQADPNAPPARPGTAADAAACVEAHMEAVFRYVRRRVGGQEVADVVQQTFAALFRAHAKGRPPEDPGAYLLGTARRRIADLHRRSARRQEVVGLPEGWAGYVDRVLPEDVLADAELRELVHVALGLLPTAARALLLGYYQGGHPVAELAARLGVTPKAAELRLRRARQAFRTMFASVGRDYTEGWHETGKDD